MKTLRILLILAAIAGHAPAARAIATVSELIDSLAAGGCYQAAVDYTVSLPQAQDDVRYTVMLQSAPAAPADTLSPVDYIISWQLHAPSGADTEGFSAYTAGHHYRFRGDRLQEYHTGWDAAPFATRRQNGRSFPGVQRTAQFASLLPGFMALDLRDMAADTLYTLTLLPAPSDGRIKLRAVMTVQGMECIESVYTFATSPLRPLSVDTEANMGTISEQSTSARFRYADSFPAPCPDVTEEALAERWPDAFTRFRESNFRIENLPGSPLPAFSLPCPAGGRITHHRGEPMEAPAIIVILDPAKGFAAETVSEVRKAAEALPFEPQILWALTSTNPESALALTGPLRPGETAAISASGLARDCGAASLPVIILCDSSATVKNVVLGFNNDLASVVMQKMSILK